MAALATCAQLLVACTDDGLAEDAAEDAVDSDQDDSFDEDESEEADGWSTGSEPFALYDLFSSQGCYSCPAADELLSEELAQARDEGVRFFPLAWHVDYWDYLGWEDSWGHEDFTQRQYDYAAEWSATTVYTPQGVVNGKGEGFVGSSAEELSRAVNQALEWEPEATVSLRLIEAAQDSREVRVELEVGGAPEGSLLHLAVVERSLVEQPKRGENAGDTLRGDNVVRSWTQLSPDTEEVSLTVPDDLVASESSLVVWVQTEELRVVGAHMIDLLDVIQ